MFFDNVYSKFGNVFSSFDNVFTNFDNAFSMQSQCLKHNITMGVSILFYQCLFLLDNKSFIIVQPLLIS